MAESALNEWQTTAENIESHSFTQSKRNKRSSGTDTTITDSVRPTRTSRRRRTTANVIVPITSPIATRSTGDIKPKMMGNKLATGRKSSALVFPPPFQCPNCGRRYQRLQTLKRHLRTECNQPKKFICKICDRRFHHNFKLDEHYTRVHGLRP